MAQRRTPGASRDTVETAAAAPRRAAVVTQPDVAASVAGWSNPTSDTILELQRLVGNQDARSILANATPAGTPHRPHDHRTSRRGRSKPGPRGSQVGESVVLGAGADHPAPPAPISHPVVNRGERSLVEVRRGQWPIQRELYDGKGDQILDKQAGQVAVEQKSGMKFDTRQKAFYEALFDSPTHYSVIEAADSIITQHELDVTRIRATVDQLARTKATLLKMQTSMGSHTIKDIQMYSRDIRSILAEFFGYFLGTDPRVKDLSFIVVANASLEREEMSLGSDLDAGIAIDDANPDTYADAYAVFNEVAKILGWAAQRAEFLEGGLVLDGNPPARLTLRDFAQQCQLSNNILNDMSPLLEIGGGRLSRQFGAESKYLKRSDKLKILSTAKDVVFAKEFIPSGPAAEGTAGSGIDIKTSYLRSMTLLTRDIATLMDIRDPSTDARIKALMRRGMDEEMGVALLRGLEFCLVLRNKLHLHYGTENDMVYIRPKSTMFSALFGSGPSPVPDPYYASTEEVELLTATGKAVLEFRKWASGRLKEIEAELTKPKTPDYFL